MISCSSEWVCVSQASAVTWSQFWKDYRGQLLKPSALTIYRGKSEISVQKSNGSGGLRPGGLCKWWSTPGSTPYFSYEAFAGLKHYTPFYAHYFHPGGLCKWQVPPVLPPISVMRLLRVWSIVPLFTHIISTQMICVNGEHPRLNPVPQI